MFGRYDRVAIFPAAGNDPATRRGFLPVFRTRASIARMKAPTSQHAGTSMCVLTFAISAASISTMTFLAARANRGMIVAG